MTIKKKTIGRYYEIDYVIDTLGSIEFYNELSVLKKGGKLLSLRTAPNREFAIRNNFSLFKKCIFTMAGIKYDKAAKKQDKEYRFMFVHSDGSQLKKITRIVEENNIIPTIDPHVFTLEQVDDALNLIMKGYTKGKVIIQI